MLNGGDCGMGECSGIIYAMQHRIKSKLLALDATSKEKAVTAQGANLDVQESNWLRYVTGGLFAVVKRTKDKRYYVSTTF
jgi:hypothetical protein